jgi:hypothetical protein
MWWTTILLENEVIGLSCLGKHKVPQHSQANWAIDSVLNEEGFENVVQHDTAPHVCLGAATNLLYYGMLVLTAPNSAVMVVYYTTCVESSLISEENSVKVVVICINLSPTSVSQNLPFGAHH